MIRKKTIFFYYMNKNQNSFGLNQDSRKANKIGKKKFRITSKMGLCKDTEFKQKLQNENIVFCTRRGQNCF